MNKKLVALVLVPALLAATSVQPRRAEAIVGAFTGGGLIVPGLIVMGASVGGGAAIAGAGLAFGCQIQGDCSEGNFVGVLGFFGGAIVAALGLLTGLVLLDNGGAHDLQYAALSPAQASQLGVTPDQQEQYRQELPEINAIAQQIANDMVHDGKTAPSRDTADYIARKWSDYGAGISPDSLTVVQKIGDQFAQHAMAHAQAQAR
jgi:hypothetical protein